MSTGPIKLLKKGEVPSLADTDKGNELIRVINAIATMQVTPQGAGKFVQQGDAAVLDISASDAGVAARVKLLERKMTELIDSLHNSYINANCDPNTSGINISITFPNLPNNDYGNNGGNN